MKNKVGERMKKKIVCTLCGHGDWNECPCAAEDQRAYWRGRAIDGEWELSDVRKSVERYKKHSKKIIAHAFRWKRKFFDERKAHSASIKSLDQSFHEHRARGDEYRDLFWVAKRREQDSVDRINILNDRIKILERAASMAQRELSWMLSAFPDRRGGRYERALNALEDALSGIAYDDESDVASGDLTLSEIREANERRQKEWAAGDEKPSVMYRAVELAGETGELLNVIKKLEREEIGWAGSRASMQDLEDEIGDVLICLDLLAHSFGIPLDRCVSNKFNKTSKKIGLSAFIRQRWELPHDGKAEDV